MSQVPYAWVMVRKDSSRPPAVFIGSVDPRTVHDSGELYDYFPLFTQPCNPLAKTASHDLAPQNS